MGVCELESKERVARMYLGWPSLSPHLLLCLAHDSPETTPTSQPVTENLMSINQYNYFGAQLDSIYHHLKYRFSLSQQVHF